MKKEIIIGLVLFLGYLIYILVFRFYIINIGPLTWLIGAVGFFTIVPCAVLLIMFFVKRIIREYLY